MKQARQACTRVLVIAAIAASCARPLPASAEITINTETYANQAMVNPFPTQANIDLLKEAIYTLAADPKLANHPIRRYLNDPQAKGHIVFDNVRAARGAIAFEDKVYLRSKEDMSYYLTFVAHEFIHADMSEKYNSSFNYSFLDPVDAAFLNVMEEAFANTMDVYVLLTYPDSTRDYQIRNWENQSKLIPMVSAMANDYKADYPYYSEDQILSMVLEQMLLANLTYHNNYTGRIIPNNMARDYRDKNTFLIPEYAAYKEHGDALARHMWNHLASLMPFTLSPNKNYDYFRNRFMSDVRFWAEHAEKPEDSILYWIQYDAVGNARAKIDNQNSDEIISYDYLPAADEERLNKVMLEIDPSFVPVNTSITFERILQEAFQRNR